MNNEILETKLTPAAREALDELVQDIRHQILADAELHAARVSGKVREISVRDLFDASQVRRSGTRLSFVERLVSMYAATGAIMGLGSLLYAYASLAVGGMVSRVILLAGVAGILLSALSSTWLLRSRLRGFDIHPIDRLRPTPLESSDMSLLFVKRWQEIELAIRDLVASKLGESIAVEPLSILIERLRKAHILSAKDESKFRALLGLRNRILHQGEELDRTRYDLAMKDAESLILKIRAQK